MRGFRLDLHGSVQGPVAGYGLSVSIREWGGISQGSQCVNCSGQSGSDDRFFSK
jgi:hypothetical protein